MRRRVVLLILGYVLLSIFPVRAQQQGFQAAWNAVEEDIGQGHNLLHALDRINGLLEQSRQTGDEIGTIRGLYDRLRIRDKRTEDTLFFQNFSELDSVLHHPSSPLLDAVAHVLKAQRIHRYNLFYRDRGNRILFRSNDPAIDYASLSPAVLDSLVHTHLDTALGVGDAILRRAAEDLLWLVDDPLIFLYRPVVGDLVYDVQLSILQRDRNGLRTAPAPWLAMTQQDFLSLPDAYAGFTPAEQKVWREYKQWMAFHANVREVDAVLYIETLARKFMYQGLDPDSLQSAQYQAYLEELVHAPSSVVRVHGVYQLCLLWNSLGGLYHPQRKYDASRVMHYGFDSSYRLYYVKALRLYQANLPLLDSFPFIRLPLIYMSHDIQAPSAKVKMDAIQLPDVPLLAMLTYRNVRQLHVRVVRLPDEMHVNPIGWLLGLPITRDVTQYLPVSDDYQMHNAFLKLDALPAGRYAFIYWDTDTLPPPTGGQISYTEVTVTRIGAVYDGQRLYVLDRATGFPLGGASVQGERVSGASNREGFLYWSGDDHLTIGYQGDTLIQHISDRSPKAENDDDDEDRLANYLAHTQVHMYTDRGIYRPGQQIFFKGILVTRDPITGEVLPLTHQNIRLPVLQKLWYRLANDRTRNKVGILIKDPFGKVIDSIKVRPNAFGSFADSVAIPRAAATGEWSFATDANTGMDISEQNNTFRVEEYKRPSFAIVLQKPERVIALPDSFSVKVQVSTFAGAPLDKVRLQYSMVRDGYYPDGGYRSKVPVTAGNAYTDAQGTFRLAVNDTLLHAFRWPEDRSVLENYKLTVEATDATGESHDEQLEISLTNRPITLSAVVGSSFDRSHPPVLYISASNEFVGPLQKPVTIRVFREPDDSAGTGMNRSWEMPADVSLYDSAQWRRWFPDVQIPDNRERSRQPARLVYETQALAGGADHFVFPPSLLASGRYSLEIICAEGGSVKGKRSYSFSVFDKAANTFPSSLETFAFLPSDVVSKGKPVSWITGQHADKVFSIYTLMALKPSAKGSDAIRYYSTSEERQGLQEHLFRVPPGVAEKILLTRVFFLHNKMHSEQAYLYIPDTQTHSDIIVEQYRRTLIPGAQETFTVSVKTHNLNTAAELMTTLYDASLDKLSANQWSIPAFNEYSYLNDPWDYDANSRMEVDLSEPVPASWLSPTNQMKAIWWMQSGRPGAAAVLGNAQFDFDGYYDAYKRLPGEGVLSSQGLDEVVVIGYGIKRRLMGLAAGVSVSVRGNASLISAAKGVLVVLDGVVYNGDISSLDAQQVTNALVLKGADAIALFGASAANGVLVLSTKGPIVLPPPAPEAVPRPVVRKNFAETAFFYPQLYASRDGLYHIHFTLPESVTKWRWQLLAYTRRGQFAYLEKALVSQLPLMVQPDVPRFLYQGDSILLQCRITNMDSTLQKGTLRCVVADEVTGRDLSMDLLTTDSRSFTVEGRSTVSSNISLRVPGDLLHPLRIRVTVSTHDFSDGEEHILPVLSRQMLVAQKVPLSVDGSTGIDVQPPVLPRDAVPYGTGLYITPQPHAAVIDALPSLVEYPYGCAEQTFDKWLAYSVACQLVRVDTSLQKQPAAGGVSPEIPDAPAESMMPWLALNHSNLLQQQQLSGLFDTANARRQMEQYSMLLGGMQNMDGGMAWFKGGRSDLFVSCYILGGLGRAVRDSLPLGPSLQRLLPGLIRFCDASVSDPEMSWQRPSYAYARTFWLQEYPITSGILESAFKDWGEYSLGNLAMTATAAMRYGKAPYVQQARDQLESLRQRAIDDPVNGTRWKALADADDLNSCTEEWMVRLSEAFDVMASHPEVTDGIIHWLLTAKSDHSWSTTKATASVVSLLYRHAALPVSPNVLSAGARLRVSNDLRGGRLYDFDSCGGQPFPSSLVIRQTGIGMVSGGLTYYYFTATPPLSSSSNGLSLTRTLERFNSQTGVWEIASMPLHTGDRIRATLTITAPRRLQYVFIEDKRAAALEPVDDKSGYQYMGGLYYYQSVRDAGVQFFAEEVPSGVSHIVYEMTVNHEGSFTYAPASLQCMYRPDIQAYSGTGRLSVASVQAPAGLDRR